MNLKPATGGTPSKLTAWWFVGAFLLTACAAPEHGVESPAVQTLEGEVLYRERILLTPGHQMTVTLEDVARMDVAADIVASTTVPIEGSPPFAFTLEFNASDINPPDRYVRYALRARIERDDKLQFINDTRHDAFGDVSVNQHTRGRSSKTDSNQ
jgi:putative lipoprotein